MHASSSSTQTLRPLLVTSAAAVYRLTALAVVGCALGLYALATFSLGDGLSTFSTLSVWRLPVLLAALLLQTAGGYDTPLTPPVLVAPPSRARAPAAPQSPLASVFHAAQRLSLQPFSFVASVLTHPHTLELGLQCAAAVGIAVRLYHLPAAPPVFAAVATLLCVLHVVDFAGVGRTSPLRLPGSWLGGTRGAFALSSGTSRGRWARLGSVAPAAVSTLLAGWLACLLLSLPVMVAGWLAAWAALRCSTFGLQFAAAIARAVGAPWAAAALHHGLQLPPLLPLVVQWWVQLPLLCRVCGLVGVFRVVEGGVLSVLLTHRPSGDAGGMVGAVLGGLPFSDLAPLEDGGPGVVLFPALAGASLPPPPPLPLRAELALPTGRACQPVDALDLRLAALCDCLPPRSVAALFARQPPVDGNAAAFVYTPPPWVVAARGDSDLLILGQTGLSSSSTKLPWRALALQRQWQHRLLTGEVAVWAGHAHLVGAGGGQSGLALFRDAVLCATPPPALPSLACVRAPSRAVPPVLHARVTCVGGARMGPAEVARLVSTPGAWHAFVWTVTGLLDATTLGLVTAAQHQMLPAAATHAAALKARPMVPPPTPPATGPAARIAATASKLLIASGVGAAAGVLVDAAVTACSTVAALPLFSAYDPTTELTDWIAAGRGGGGESLTLEALVGLGGGAPPPRAPRARPPPPPKPEELDAVLSLQELTSIVPPLLQPVIAGCINAVDVLTSATKWARVPSLLSRPPALRAALLLADCRGVCASFDLVCCAYVDALHSGASVPPDSLTLLLASAHALLSAM